MTYEVKVDSPKEVFTHRVRAGKRTYFFDVKVTRHSDHYITITESKRVGENEYEKHKIFLYREDFVKFVNALHDVVDYIEQEFPDDEIRQIPGKSEETEKTEENNTEID